MKKKKRRFGCLTVILAIVTFFMFRDSNNRVVTDEFDVAVRDLPASFDGYRITIVSDLHAREFTPGNAELIKQIRATDPDIIAVTGDLIDANGQLETVLPFMRAMSDIAPTYYVTGNHEWATDEARELLRRLPDYGVIVMENKYVTLTVGAESVTLVGFSDPNGFADAPKRSDVMRTLPDDECVIALIHRNKFFEELSGYGIDLILCGHAHGGVIRIPGTDGLLDHDGLFPKFTSGVYEMDGSKMLVSRGLGNIFGIPRFLNNPEIAVAILRTET